MMLILLASCGAQSVLIAVHQFYRLNWLRPVQPVTAAMLPALAYLSFMSSTRRRFLWHRDLWHLLPVVFLLFCVVLFPQAVDATIPAFFQIYGTTLLLSLYQGGDSLILMRLDSDNIPLRIWQSIAAALLILGLGEIGIGLAHAIGHSIWQPMIISVLSSMTLLWLRALGLSPHLHLPNNPQEPSQEAAPEPCEATTQLVDRL